MAANPGMTTPNGKVFVPVSGNKINTTSYSRPANQTSSAGKAAKVVKAQAGDTVAKVATRHNGADPVEVAKYNGLLPNSVLGAGREIKLPQAGMKE